MTVTDQLTHKAQLLVDLRLQEDFLNRELSLTDKSIRFVKQKAITYKKRISKQVSHNMQLRNKVINEISELKKQL